MANDSLKKKLSWFMSVNRCPFSGLEITHQETLVCSDPKSDFYVDIALLGHNMILVKAYGYVTSFAELEMQAFIDNFILSQCRPEAGLVYIEDYVAVTGANAEARKKYISYLKNHHDFIGIILFSLPPIFKISFNLAKKLHIYAARAHAVDTYEQAVDLAGKLNAQKAVSDNADMNQSVSPPNSADSQPKPSAVSRVPGLVRRMFAKWKASSFIFTEKAKPDLARQHSEELVKFIAAIDWKNPGMPAAENILNDEAASKIVFDAISFVKSEIDTLLAQRESAEAVLKESEARYRLLLKHAKAGFLEYNYTTGQIISVNDEFIHMTGYPEQELLGKNPVELLSEDSKKIFLKRLSQIKSGEPISQDIVYQGVTKNNELRWWLLNSNVTYQDYHPEKASVVLTDITKLKDAENQLLEYQEKLKRLSIRSSMIEEDQRRSMASHLHETIGQELFVMQMQLNAFEKSIENPTLLPPLKQVREQLLNIIKETKNLTFDLSPPVLYDFGFREALQTLSENIELKHNIRVRTYFEGKMDAFGNELKVILYRNIKELIHNTVKHADAKNIAIRLENSQSGLWVELCDDGVGFDPADYNYEASAHDGFGLFDIREKLNHLGGSLIIDSAPGKGTTICMKVPMQLRN